MALLPRFSLGASFRSQLDASGTRILPKIAFLLATSSSRKSWLITSVGLLQSAHAVPHGSRHRTFESQEVVALSQHSPHRDDTLGRIGKENLDGIPQVLPRDLPHPKWNDPAIQDKGLAGQLAYHEVADDARQAAAVFNVELRFPVAGQLHGGVFYDAGNVFALSKHLNLGNLRHSAGFGLRYILPFGPARLDWGFVLDPREGEKRSRLHFSLGHAF